jgi:hypothetical protein
MPLTFVVLAVAFVHAVKKKPEPLGCVRNQATFWNL